MFLREGIPRRVKILPYKYELAVNLILKPYGNLINKIIKIAVYKGESTTRLYFLSRINLFWL